MKELNDFVYQLEQAQKSISRLDGPLTRVQFDPDQPGSINAAIGKMEAEIDRSLAPYRNNPFVVELADEAKEQFAEEIRSRATKARSAREDGADNMDPTIFRCIESTVDDLKWAERAFDLRERGAGWQLHRDGRIQVRFYPPSRSPACPA